MEIKMISRVLDGKSINGMLRALRSAKVFTIERDTETIVVNHTKSGKEVLRALKKGNQNIWITRLMKNLFLNSI